jgi:hypothetical protein
LTLVKELVIHIVIEEDLEITISSGEVPLSHHDPNPPSLSPRTNALECFELGPPGKNPSVEMIVQEFRKDCVHLILKHVRQVRI